jgi:hypothetical protein
MRRKILMLSAIVILPGFSLAQTGDTNKAELVEEAGFWKLQNGYLALRLPKANAFNPANAQYTLAPIQSVIYRSGEISDGSPNYLTLASSTTQLVFPETMEVTPIQYGTDSITVKITYRFRRPASLPCQPPDPPAPTAPAGYYSSTITLRKGDKAATMLEETNYDLSYEIKLGSGKFDKARYRGFYSNATTDGYELNGTNKLRYGSSTNFNNPPGYDALVDLQFNGIKQYTALAKWNPWAINTGWYWQLYADSGNSQTDMTGIFAARPSQIIGNTGGGVQVFSKAAGVNYTDADYDAAGNAYIIWQNEEAETWYMKVEANTGNYSAPEKLGNTGDVLLNPDIHVQNGRITVVAFWGNAPTRNKIKIFNKAITQNGFSENILTSTFVEYEYPFAYGASTATHDYLISYGRINGNLKLLLFYKTIASDLYQFNENDTNLQRSIISHAWQIHRPEVKSFFDNRVMALFPLPNSITAMAEVVNVNGSIRFSDLPYGTPAVRVQCDGVTIDKRSRTAFIHNNTQPPPAFNLFKPDNNALARLREVCTVPAPVPAISGETGYNRRSLASGNTGNFLLCNLLTPLNEFRFYYREAGSVNWEPLNNNPSGLNYVQVLFNAAKERFEIFGVRNGILKRYSFTRATGFTEEADYAAFTEKKDAGLRISFKRKDAGQQFNARVRFEWGLFVSKKTDLPSNLQAIQPINVEMNKLGGLAKRIDNYPVYEPVDAFNNGSIYISAAKIDAFISKLRTDAALYNDLFNMCLGTGQDKVLQALKMPNTVVPATATLPNPNNETYFERAYNTIIDRYELVKQHLKTGEGIYLNNFGYFRASDKFRSDMQVASCLQALKEPNLFTAANGRKQKLREIASTYAQIVWDDDFVPLVLRDSSFPSCNNTGEYVHGVNLGNENMLPDYQAGRNFFALLFNRVGADSSGNPFPALSTGVKNNLVATLRELINEYGSSWAGPHYTNTLSGSIQTLLQLRAGGGEDIIETLPRMKRFAEAYAHLYTPPSVRFSQTITGATPSTRMHRKLISMGDGGEESQPLAALLSTALDNGDTANAEWTDRFAHLYFRGPKERLTDGFIFMMFDFANKNESNVPAFKPLADAAFPGFASTLRNTGVNNYAPVSQNDNPNNETAAWIINGNFYRDHRNDDDGELGIYALKTPLSISRNCLYNPSANAATIRSMVLPASTFPSWNGNNQPIYTTTSLNRTWVGDSLGNQTRQEGFAAFRFSGYSKSNMFRNGQQWNRSIMNSHNRPDYPVIVIQDELINTATENIWSMLNMSKGEIKYYSPGGLQSGGFTPDDQVSDNNNQNPILDSELPDAKPTGGALLEPGITRFHFTGQLWKGAYYNMNTPTAGIDWELFTISNDTGRRFTVSQWTNTSIESPELGHYQANYPPTYRETQQILRIKGKGNFFTVLTPYSKNQPPANLSLTETGNGIFTLRYDGVVLQLQGINNVFDDSAQHRTVLTTYNNQALNYSEMKITGGAAEMEILSDSITVMLHGLAGSRTLKLPDNHRWACINNDGRVTYKSATREWKINYAGMGNNLWFTPSSPNKPKTYIFINADNCVVCQ